jgi:hypothetical protein
VIIHSLLKSGSNRGPDSTAQTSRAPKWLSYRAREGDRPGVIAHSRRAQPREGTRHKS